MTDIWFPFSVSNVIELKPCVVWNYFLSFELNSLDIRHLVWIYLPLEIRTWCLVLQSHQTRLLKLRHSKPHGTIESSHNSTSFILPIERIMHMCLAILKSSKKRARLNIKQSRQFTNERNRCWQVSRMQCWSTYKTQRLLLFHALLSQKSRSGSTNDLVSYLWRLRCCSCPFRGRRTQKAPQFGTYWVARWSA